MTAPSNKRTARTLAFRHSLLRYDREHKFAAAVLDHCLCKDEPLGELLGIIHRMVRLLGNENVACEWFTLEAEGGSAETKKHRFTWKHLANLTAAANEALGGGNIT